MEPVETKLDKRKRRPVKTESDVTESPEKQSKRGTPSVTSNSSADSKINSKNPFYYEESTVNERNPEEDVAFHRAASNELHSVMAQIQKIKEGDTSQPNKALENLYVHGALQFITLRKLNRVAHFRCKNIRDATNEAKQKIDQQHLQLQNLLYEGMHLQKEINKCLEFKSKDEEIVLVDVDEFYQEAPAEISKPEVTQNDVHQQTLARLDWELEQRKRLSIKLTEAESSREQLYQEIKTKKEYLESLQPKLNAILQATKPVQEYLGMPFDEIRDQHRLAVYLPRPLYVLFMQASAYKDACDKLLTVTIMGDIEEAKAQESCSVAVMDEDSDSDQEDQDKASGKRRHRNLSENRTLQKHQRLLKKHPLCVLIIVPCKDGSTLSLTFHFLVNLEVVVVVVKLTPSTDALVTTISGGDLLSPETLLSCLYPDDYGTETPNPSSRYVLLGSGVDDFSSYLAEVGIPYMWAQRLCGLQFLEASQQKPQAGSTSKACTAGSMAQQNASCMEATVYGLRKRVLARMTLLRQLESLERCVVPVTFKCQSLFPAKISCHLTQWQRSTFNDFASLPYTQSALSSGVAKPSDLFFTAIVERGSAKMVAQVVLAPDYPDTAPLFLVNVLWKTELNSTNDENLRDLETEVNAYYSELISVPGSVEFLLSNQLQRLLVCFDVYLESSESANSTGEEGPREFPKEKIFPRAARGPLRSRPYRFNAVPGYFFQR